MSVCVNDLVNFYMSIDRVTEMLAQRERERERERAVDTDRRMYRDRYV